MATGELALHAVDALDAPAHEAEAGLIDQCCRGDQVAFGQLVARHQGMVYNLAARLLGDAEEARDLAQDVFLTVHRMLPTFRGQSSLKTWIYRIVVNQSRNRLRWWRRRRRDRSIAIETLGPADAARLAVGERNGASPYELVKRHEREARVQAALLAISFDHRAVLLLKEVEEMSCDEIAAALGLPEGTVKSRLSRAREALRAVLVAADEESR